jgi:hypothetical protein
LGVPGSSQVSLYGTSTRFVRCRLAAEWINSFEFVVCLHGRPSISLQINGAKVEGDNISTNEEENILEDGLGTLWNILSGILSSNANQEECRVDIVLENAGIELFGDLLFGVCLHCEPLRRVC